MEFLELCKKRYSVRDFSSVKVEEEKLSKILEAGAAFSDCEKFPVASHFCLKIRCRAGKNPQGDSYGV